MNDDLLVDLNNERLTSKVLRDNLFAARAAVVIAAAKIDKVAALARRLRADGHGEIADLILEALA